MGRVPKLDSKEMFEKFTEESIKIIKLAQEEAKRLEFHCINPEHILLGIISESYGKGAKILCNLGLDLKTARILIEKIVGRGYISVPLDEISFSSEVQNIINRSIEITESMNFNTVTSEHLLMALMEIEDNKQLSLIKREFDLNTEKINEEFSRINQLLEAENIENNNSILPEHFNIRYATSVVTDILESARNESVKQGHIMIGTEQILCSLSMEPQSFVSLILKKYDLTPEMMQIEIYRLIGKGSGSIPELVGYNDVVNRSFEIGWQQAKRKNYKKLGSGHLLLGMLNLPESSASFIVKHLGKNSEQICLDILSVMKNHPGNPEPCIADIDNELVNQAFVTRAEDETDKQELNKMDGEQ